MRNTPPIAKVTCPASTGYFPRRRLYRLLDKARKAATALLEQSGYVEDAVGLLSESGDWRNLSRLILSRANSLLVQGRYQRLQEWINALPKEVLDDDPWLLYWKGVSLMPFSPAESRDCFEEALNKFDARREAQGVFRSWAGVVESIISPMENLKPVDAWVDLLPRLLVKYGDLPPGEIGEAVTASMYRALSYRQYPREAVELWTPRAIAVARTTTNKRLKFMLTLGILVSFQITKDTREAERLFASLRAMLLQPDATPLMRLSVDFVEAVSLNLSARYERCLRVTADGLAFAEDTGVHVLDALLQAYGAIAALKLRDFETANRHLDRIRSALYKMKPLPSGMFHCITALEALKRGDLETAAFHSREGQRLWEESGFTTHLPSARLFAAHVRHALHEDEEAFRIVAETCRIGHEIRNFYSVWLSHLTEAYFHLDRNDNAAAIAPLKKGLQVGRETRLFGTALWRPDMFEKLCVKALEEGIEVDYVREFIRRNRLAPDPGNPDLGNWPWQVKVYTLGRFGLLVDDGPVERGRKVQQKPLALLKALVALGGRGVGEGRLAELLWPEADGDLAYKSFSVTLTRLRKLLGTEEALMLKEGRLSLSNRQCWVDAWAFERFLGQAERARKGETVQEATRLFEKALSLYQGPFLTFEEYPWADSLREKLRSGFLRAVAHLGQIYEDSERWREAVSCYGKGIEADELAEDLYRRLIVCLIRQARHAEALSVYRRCKKKLSLILGVEPSAQTRAIASSLGRFRV
jgi:DNA-binding SARP family transcriptional activator